MDKGIYTIRNIITGQIYVGSGSGVRGIPGRWSGHRSLLRNNKHDNPKLQNSWNKHKEENFEFAIVEYVSPEKCIEREQYFIDTLKPYFNILPNAASRLGSKFSQETIEKLKGRTPWNKGNKKPKKRKTEEELLAIKKARAKKCQQLGLSLTGIKRPKDVVEKYASKRRIPVIATNLMTKEEIAFSGVRVAARALNLDVSMISKVCKGKHSYYKEWTFRYGN